tara:strand:+ start:31683 stop:32879 length:1197 start_codon:yes stop_codon:yes gene_type:complete
MQSFVPALQSLDVEAVVVMPSSGFSSSFPPPFEVWEEDGCEARLTMFGDIQVILLHSPNLDEMLYPESETACLLKMDFFGVALAKFLPKLKADVLHLMDAPGWRALLAARDAGVPTMLTAHLLHRWIPFVVFAEHVAIQMVDRVVVVSQSYLDDNRALLAHSRSPALAIANGIDEEFWDLGKVAGDRASRRTALLKENALDDGVLFVTASRLNDEQKGMDVLCGVLESWDDWGQARFLIVGAGEPATVARFAALAALHPDKLALIAEHRPLEFVRTCFAAADAMIVPSRFEPFGLTQVEAMAMGALPLVSRTGGLKEINLHHSAPDGFGCTFTPESESDLHAKLIEMLEVLANGDVETLRQNARRAASKRSVKNCAKEYVAEYGRLASELAAGASSSP